MSEDILAARCGSCGKVWKVADLPMSMRALGKLLKKTKCPDGCDGGVFLANSADIPLVQP